MEGTIVTLATIIIAVVVVGFLKRDERNHWSRAAQELGLEYVPSPEFFGKGMIIGNYEGFEVEVKRLGPTELPASLPHEGHRRQSCTCLHTRMNPPLDQGLIILRQVTVFGVKVGISRHQIETGDAAFDEVFTLKSDEETKTLQFVTPLLRATLMHCKASFTIVEDDGPYMLVQHSIADEEICRIIKSQHQIVAAAREAQRRLLTEDASS